MFDNKKLLVWSISAIVLMVLIWRVSVALKRFRLANSAKSEVNGESLTQPLQFYKNLSAKAYKDFWDCFGTWTRWGGCDDEAAAGTVKTLAIDMNDDELKQVSNEYRKTYKRSLRTDVSNYRWWVFNEPSELKELKNRFDELSIA